LNDKEMGNEQLAKAKELSVTRVGANFDVNGEGVEGLSGDTNSDGSPCVFISGEPEKLGQITYCNMSLCKVFGYNKRDALIGREVEILMPKIYAKNHKKVLEHAI
jgi:hypothetical protein